MHDIHKYNVKIVGSDSKPVAYLDHLLDMLYNYELYPKTATYVVISSVVECLTRDRGATGSSLMGVTVSYPWAGHINLSLVLV